MGHLICLTAGIDFERERERPELPVEGFLGGETSRQSLAPSLGPAHRSCLEPFKLALKMPVSTVETDVKVYVGS